MTMAAGHARRWSRAFTLVEVLAAIMVIAIVLPAVMGAISIATNMATAARFRTEATTLGQEKLQELLATGDWQNGSLAGDFGDQWPGFKWSANVDAFNADNAPTVAANLQELDVVVTWTQRGKEQQMTLSTLVYQNATSSSSSTTGGTTP